MLARRDPVGVDRLDVRRVGLAAPAGHEAFGDRVALVDPGLRHGGHADAARGLRDVGQRHHRGAGQLLAGLVRGGVQQRPVAPVRGEHGEGGLHVDPDVAGVHRDRERVGRRQAGPEPAVDQQRPDVAERHPPDEILDVDAPVTQRPAVLVRLGDLGAERDVALEARLEAGRGRGCRSARVVCSPRRARRRRRSRRSGHPSSSSWYPTSTPTGLTTAVTTANVAGVTLPPSGPGGNGAPGWHPSPVPVRPTARQPLDGGAAMVGERPADMRVDYQEPGFDVDDLLPTWHEQLAAWLAEADAAGVAEANAMVLATADPDGCPSSRTVLCKGLDARGVVFYTNYTSAKSRDLRTTRRASATFPWYLVHRQVQVRGTVELVSAGGVPGLLGGAATRFPTRRVGIGAVDGRDAPPGPRRRAGSGDPAVRRHRRAVAAALGRLAHHPGDGGVLAGPHRPDARQAALRARPDRPDVEGAPAGALSAPRRLVVVLGS